MNQFIMIVLTLMSMYLLILNKNKGIIFTVISVASIIFIEISKSYGNNDLSTLLSSLKLISIISGTVGIVIGYWIYKDGVVGKDFHTEAGLNLKNPNERGKKMNEFKKEYEGEDIKTILERSKNYEPKLKDGSKIMIVGFFGIVMGYSIPLLF